MADRLNHNDEACFRAILADNPTTTTAGFTASIASLRGLIGELDHLRARLAAYPEACGDAVIDLMAERDVLAREVERLKAPDAGGLL